MQPKAIPSDMFGRFREIVSDPINLLIWRSPNAGQVTPDHFVHLHNGLRVPVSGENAYYGNFSLILTINRGVHEPLEEFVFQEVIKFLPEAPTMLELGAYWGHYSMWLKKARPAASVRLVEPEMANLQVGFNNFSQNGLEGEFLQSFVGKGQFEVDEYMKKMDAHSINVLHCDIQGYELEMLEGARGTLSGQKVDYVFISTHSQELHAGVIGALKEYGYNIEVESDYALGSTSYDGLVFASRPGVASVFNGFSPMQRVQLEGAQPADLVAYVTHVKNAMTKAGGV